MLLVVGPYICFIKFILHPYAFDFPTIGDGTLVFCVHTLVSTALVTLLLSSHLLSCFCDPGSPPKGWQPDTEVGSIPRRRHRFCEKCNCFKPPRTHHCRACNKCILKMDHHCPWISSCVGHLNHKYFLLFLFYVVVSISYALVMVSLFLVDIIEHLNFSTFRPGQLITFVLFACLVLPLGIAVGALGWWQLWLVTHNMTSIENEIKESPRPRNPRRNSSNPSTATNDYSLPPAHNYTPPAPYNYVAPAFTSPPNEAAEDLDDEWEGDKNPYDLGSFVENLKVVLGKNVWLWLLPTPGTTFDEGLHWRKVLC